MIPDSFHIINIKICKLFRACFFVAAYVNRVMFRVVVTALQDVKKAYLAAYHGPVATVKIQQKRSTDVIGWLYSRFMVRSARSPMILRYGKKEIYLEKQSWR